MCAFNPKLHISCSWPFAFPCRCDWNLRSKVWTMGHQAAPILELGVDASAITRATLLPPRSVCKWTKSSQRNKIPPGNLVLATSSREQASSLKNYGPNACSLRSNRLYYSVTYKASISVKERSMMTVTMGPSNFLSLCAAHPVCKAARRKSYPKYIHM